MQDFCACGSGLLYSNCCEPVISGIAEAVTAQQLMRSRYVAFTQANAGYLLSSHSAKTRPLKERKSIEKWAKSVTWIGLSILSIQAGKADDEVGYVEFIAMYLEDGRLQQIHENSRFERENGKWVYVSGVHIKE